MIEPTPFRDGTSLELSSHLQGRYAVKSSARQPNISQQFVPVNRHQPQHHSSRNMYTSGITTVDGIIRYAFPPEVSYERASSHVRGVSETPLAYRSQLKGVRRDQQFAIDAPDDDFRNDPTKPRYKSYQQDQWDRHYQELLKFKAKHGHCNVPHTYDDNPSLARWAKRQRYQYTRKLEQKQSCLSDARKEKLDAVGFVWDLQTMAWQGRFKELVEYKRNNGHCNVPNRCRENRALGMWAKTQRLQYKLYRYKPFTSRLTPGRFQLLTNLGFMQRDEELPGKRNKKDIWR